MDNTFFEEYRKEFPITGKYIYLDHAGVAPVSLRVKQAVDAFLSESTEGGAFHYPRWAQQIVNVRNASARLIGAQRAEIAFVKSTSHGLSIVSEGLDWKPGDNVLVYEKEFPSNLYPWLNLRRKGVEVKFIPAREYGMQIEDIEGLIDGRTRLVALSSVQFTNGFRMDLGKVGELCSQKKLLFCVDAIQSLGIIPMDVKKYKIDFLSADAHKWLLGPEGIGIFYCRDTLAEKLAPPLIGWKSVKNEFGFENIDFQLKTDALRFEEGSSSVMGILGLGAALDLLMEVGIEKIEERVLNLGDTIIKEAETRGHLLLTPTNRNARGGNVTFSGYFDPIRVKDGLLKKGIMVNVRGGGLRVSPHFYNTEEELRRFFEVFDDIVRVREG